MKTLLSLVAGLALVFGGTALADDAAKEVTLKGKLVCGKCTLKEAKACCNVLQVKTGDKTVNYIIQDKGNKEAYHKAICPAGSEKDATVTGTVSDKDGKKFIKATKVDVK